MGYGALADRSRALLYGRHFTTTCKKGRRNIIHDVRRDVIYEMYKSLGIGAEKEVGGLYAVLKKNGEFRPADVLVPESASDGDKALALDVTFTDPTSKTSLEKGSDKVPLKAAAEAHRKKMEVHNRHVEMEAPVELPFEKVPLAFENTGAMGKETQQWWQSVLKWESEHRGVGETSSRMQLGLEHTWSANNFATFWSQSMSMAHFREQAETVLLWVNKCQPQQNVGGVGSHCCD